MGKPQIKISVLPRITQPFEIMEDLDVKGVVHPNLKVSPLFSPFSPLSKA